MKSILNISPGTLFSVDHSSAMILSLDWIHSGNSILSGSLTHSVCLALSWFRIHSPVSVLSLHLIHSAFLAHSTYLIQSFRMAYSNLTVNMQVNLRQVYLRIKYIHELNNSVAVNSSVDFKVEYEYR